VSVPDSKTKLAIAQILKTEGFVADYEVSRGRAQRNIKILLKYDENRQPTIAGLKRVSRPGLRTYVQKKEIPRVYGGLGIAILSTPKGVMTGDQAWKQNLGGELLCYVW
jgi:small subunit ribosomal protein S8